MSARDDFQAALADLQAYQVDGLSRRPAFIYSLARNEDANRRDVRALPRVTPGHAKEGTLVDAASRMAAGSTSASQLVLEALAAIESKDKVLNAFVHVAPAAALLEEANALDQERERGALRGPLHGIPISVKDIVHVKGMPTTASSKVLAGYMPEDDGTPVRFLKEAGAIVMGKGPYSRVRSGSDHFPKPESLGYNERPGRVQRRFRHIYCVRDEFSEPGL